MPWNLITYSEDFSNSSYIKDSGVTIGTTNNDSPIGNNTATQINVTDSGRIYKNVTSAEYRTSVYLKAGTFAYFKFIGQQVDLNLGTISSILYPSDIEDVGNGWYRISVSFGTSIRPWQIQAYPDNTYSTHTTSGNYFVWGAMLNYGDTTKPYIKTTDRLDIPRLDYTNRDCPQILIEKTATNLVPYSEDFSQWSNNNIINIDQAISPSGLTEADEMVEALTNTYQYSYIVTSGLSLNYRYVLSCFVKDIDQQYFQLSVYNGGTYLSANFDLTNESFTTAENGGQYTYRNATIEQYANDWYRVSLEFESTTTTAPIIALCNNNSATAGYIPLYTGTGKKVLVWGAQLERKDGNSGYKPTSYIPTNGTSVTRNYDYFKSGDLTSVLNTSQGVFYLDFLHYDNIIYGEFFVRPTDNSTTNAINFRTQNINNPDRNITQFSLTASGTSYGNYQWNDAYINMGVKYAFAWDGNVIKHYINGIKKSETTATFSFNADFGEIKMSRYNTPNQYLGFHNPLRQVAYFNEMLTDEELETLTTPIATSFQALAEYWAYELL